ncbi:MAG: energy-coupling factor transporter ATPase, partial [Ruminococcus sp.]|nr:energy-coupling factor transporter ATPase [Ruminococcus sp.]
ITIVLITHYMEEAVQCDRVVVMESGRIIMDNIPEKVFSQVELLRKIGLDVPQVTELCWGLKEAGVDIPQEIISEEECVKALLKLLI